MKKSSIREKAVALRKNGDSYGMISQKLGLAKSTLSDWLRNIPYCPSKEVIRRIGSARARSAQNKHSLKIANIVKAQKIASREIGTISRRDLFMLGIGLYLGEGSKVNENIRFINSDSEIIKIIVRWFEDACKLDKLNFAPRIHLYPDSNEKQSIEYWSKITGIPKSQFQKTQVDRRENKTEKRKNKLPFGTIHLQIKSLGNPNHGRFLHRKIMGWIKASLNQI